MGTGPSKIPSDTPLGCLLANLEPLRFSPDLKAKKLIFLCNQVWPQYQLDNNSKWPLGGTLDPKFSGVSRTSVNALGDYRKFPMS
jgi:hypothetical protein